MAYVTAEKIAERLNKRPQTIYKWAREGKIPCHRFGRDVLFIIEEVDECSKGGANGKSR